MSAEGGITEGASHKEGGIPMVVKSTGQNVELEGGEGVINKRNMASTKKYDFEGKELTICEIASEINQADGNGVQINCDGVVGKKYKYNDGGYVDLFEDYENIPYEIQSILDKYEEDFQDGNYNGLSKALKEVQAKGYTFEYYLDGEAFGLRPIDVKLNQLKGYEDVDDEEYSNGGYVLPKKYEKQFTEWFNDGNVILNENGTFSTQDSMYQNEFKNISELKKYFYNEFIKGSSYESGGNLENAIKHEMEHASTINKFKRKGIPTKEVAKAIATDHLKENKNYYNYLKVMEKEMNKGMSGHEVHKALSDYNKLLHRKRNRHKFAIGGNMPTKESVHIIVTEDYQPSLFQLHTGKYVGDSILRKNELNHLYYIDNDGHNSTFIYPRTDYYFSIPNQIIDLKGYSRKYEMGGNIESYQDYKRLLSTTDVRVLDILRSIPTQKLTHQDLEFISTFRGVNVVNSLSVTLITKLFGLMFKYHTISSPIKNLLISNNGTGNLLNLAPTYLENVFVDFVNNDFRPIEEQINFAQNGRKTKFFQNSYKHIDAIVHVYPITNPNTDELYSKMNQNKKGMVVVGVAEFSGVNQMTEFEKTMNVNRKEYNVNLYKVNEGITSNGKHTLIYTINTI